MDNDGRAAIFQLQPPPRSSGQFVSRGEWCAHVEGQSLSIVRVLTEQKLQLRELGEHKAAISRLDAEVAELKAAIAAASAERLNRDPTTVALPAGAVG